MICNKSTKINQSKSLNAGTKKLSKADFPEKLYGFLLIGINRNIQKFQSVF